MVDFCWSHAGASGVDEDRVVVTNVGNVGGDVRIQLTIAPPEAGERSAEVRPIFCHLVRPFYILSVLLPRTLLHDYQIRLLVIASL